MGESEIRAHGRYLLLFLPPNWRQEGKHSLSLLLLIIKGHYIITKGSVFQEDIAMLDVHAPNNRASKSIKSIKSIKQKRIKLKGEIGKFTVMLGEVNTRVSVMGRTKRQKVSMGIIITEGSVCARLNAKHLHFLIWSAQYL